MPTYSAPISRTTTRLCQPLAAKSSRRRRHSTNRSGPTMRSSAGMSARPTPAGCRGRAARPGGRPGRPGRSRGRPRRRRRRRPGSPRPLRSRASAVSRRACGRRPSSTSGHRLAPRGDQRRDDDDGDDDRARSPRRPGRPCPRRSRRPRRTRRLRRLRRRPRPRSRRCRPPPRRGRSPGGRGPPRGPPRLRPGATMGVCEPWADLSEAAPRAPRPLVQSAPSGGRSLSHSGPPLVSHLGLSPSLTLDPEPRRGLCSEVESIAPLGARESGSKSGADAQR